MSFRKPLRAVPVTPGLYYRRQQSQQKMRARKRLLGQIVLAAIAGAVIGTASIAFSQDGRAQIGAAVKPIGVMSGLVRARPPQAGDYWSGCNEARAAGTAPIFLGEPGYREGMDGDDDGIACEPHR